MFTIIMIITITCICYRSHYFNYLLFDERFISVINYNV